LAPAHHIEVVSAFDADGGKSGNGVGDIVVTARWMVDAVPTATGGPPLKGAQLRNQPRVIEQ
jgi:hypothetical protein